MLTITHLTHSKILKYISLFFKNNISGSPFYKRFHYSGSLPIKSVDWRGIVDFDFGFFFNRIPKSANSTVVINLAQLKFGIQVSSVEAKNSFMHPSHLSEQQMQLFESLFKFTIVRNPYTRTLSAYLDKILRHRKKISSFNYKSNHTPSFSDFCNYLKDGGLYSNIHWAPQSEILLLPVNRFDYIGHVESLYNDLKFIYKQITSYNKISDFKSHIPHQTNASQKLRQYYNNKNQEIVLDLFRNDFDKFGYPFDLYN